MKTSKTRLLVLTAMCVALGVILPIALHAVPNAGRVLLPMHVPVLLCGLIAGWHFGLACGILTPALSSLLTGMPPAAILPAMLCELAVYGLITGLLSGRLRLKSRVAEVYVQLAAAMLIGRVVYGAMNALIFSAGTYTLQIFLTGAFVTALPGIILQLVVIPPIILLLEKAHVLTPRAAAV